MEQFGLHRLLDRNEVISLESDAWAPVPVVDGRQDRYRGSSDRRAVIQVDSPGPWFICWSPSGATSTTSVGTVASAIRRRLPSMSKRNCRAVLHQRVEWLDNNPAICLRDGFSLNQEVVNLPIDEVAVALKILPIDIEPARDPEESLELCHAHDMASGALARLHRGDHGF